MPLPIPRPAAAVSRLFFGLKYAAALAGLLLPSLGAAQEFPRRAPALDRLADVAGRWVGRCVLMPTAAFAPGPTARPR